MSSLDSGQGAATTPLRTALRLLRVRWAAVLVAMLCVQGALVWTMPLLTSLVRWTLHLLGITGVNQYTISAVLTSPVAVLVLVAIAAVATVFVLAEVTVFAVIAHLSLEGEPVTFGSVLRRSRATVRKAAGWQGLLLTPYLTILLPLSEVGFASVLTRHVVIPDFIGGELLKTTVGSVAYLGVMGLLTYAMLRLVFFPAAVSGGEETVVQALRRSITLTTWRTLLGFGSVLLVTLVAAWGAMVLLSGLGLLPVAAARTHTAAGLVIGLLELARFLVTGTAAAFLSFYLVVRLRLAQARPVKVPPPRPAGRRTTVASVVLVVLAGALAMPQVHAATDAATRAADASPVIIGHRGHPARAVENSVPGLHAAADSGADLVETDIQETRDGGLVVMHDVGLGRLTDDDRSVHELTEEQVTSLTMHQDGHSARIPSLADYVHAADERGVRLLVELKPHGHEEPGFARRVVAALDRLDPDRTHMIQSLDRDLIHQVARIDPDRPTAYVVGFQVGDLPATTTGAVVIEDWSFHPRMLAQAHDQGRELFVWTVNDIASISDTMAHGADGVITDEVDRAAETRERLTAGPLVYYLERARGTASIG